MYYPSVDRSFLRAGVLELESYLLSDGLYWRLTGSGAESLPMLTIGGLLLARKRLEAVRDPDLAALDIELWAQRSKWRAAWERKVRRDVSARTELWHNFLSDYHHLPEKHADAYPQEVRWRVMIQLLMGELSDLPPEAEALADMDRILHIGFTPGVFIWDPVLAALFSREPYWFLYGTLKA